MHPKTTLIPAFLAALIGLADSAWAEYRWTASIHAGNTDLEVVTRKGPGLFQFWGEINEDNPGIGASLAYAFFPNLGLRLMFERSTGFEMRNRCPPDTVCPLIAIMDRADLDTWTLAATPRLHLNDYWSVYGIVGAMHWDISTRGQLPSDSGTEFTIGGGIGWRPARRFEIGLEYQHAGIDYDTWRLNFGVRF